MSKEVIFESLAFMDGYKPSPSMQGMNSSAQIRSVYIKNAIISLISIKQHNPETDVGLVVNFDIGETWRRKLEDKGIIIWECSFDSFRMSQDIVYSLSYYKLCAFRYLLSTTNYDKYCFIDCDTFAVKNFMDLWIECEEAFMIVSSDDGIEHPVRREISDLYSDLFGKTKNITHYCSGFIISQRDTAVSVILKCEEIYNRLIKLNANPTGGDEVIWSLALSVMDINIYSPKVYCLLSNIGMKEYWVDKANYHDENIVMWHLPTEKRYALIWAYDHYEKKGRLPDIDKMAKACRIRTIKNKFTWLSIMAIAKDSTALKRNILKLFKR